MRFLFALLLTLGGVANAQQVNQFVPMGYQQITDLSTAKALTVPCDASGRCATSALIVAEAQAVRFRDDGTSPTAAIGLPLAVAVPLAYSGTLSAIKFIEQTSGGKLNVLFYR